MKGHNNPPEPTPFDASKEAIEDLYIEAQNWLDGEGVNSESDAENVSKLLTLIRAAEKEADTARKEEKKPHADAAKAVDTKYKPLLDRAAMISKMCKKALSPWLQKLENERREAEQKARKEAEEKAKAAQEAMRQSHDIAAREKAEQDLKAAKVAEATANKLNKQSTNVSGGGRAVGLRTSYVPVMENATEAARHYWQTRKDDMNAMLIKFAEQDVRAGKRSIPGFRIEERKDVA